MARGGPAEAGEPVVLAATVLATLVDPPGKHLDWTMPRRRMPGAKLGHSRRGRGRRDELRHIAGLGQRRHARATVPHPGQPFQRR